MWNNETVTRLERRPELGERQVLTEQEVAALEPAAAWRKVMRVAGQPRSSFVTSPADGRVPPLKPGATPDPRVFTLGPGQALTDNPEMQAIDDRCLLAIGNLAGPVMLPLPGNSNYGFIQTRDLVVIDVEMIHDLRFIRIGAAHRTDGIRPWLGDSIGRWEGETLVVETTNFPQAQAFRGSWRNLKVTERFTRVSETRMAYRFTVEDPTLWAQPWGGEYEFKAADGPIEEYACHEGEVSVEHMLDAARAAERAAAAARPASSPPAR
ncbi:hypothetical protein BH11PSE2_BH11PSE2_03320 [soil metagenome]